MLSIFQRRKRKQNFSEKNTMRKIHQHLKWFTCWPQIWPPLAQSRCQPKRLFQGFCCAHSLVPPGRRLPGKRRPNKSKLNLQRQCWCSGCRRIGLSLALIMFGVGTPTILAPISFVLMPHINRILRFRDTVGKYRSSVSFETIRFCDLMTYKTCRSFSQLVEAF